MKRRGPCFHEMGWQWLRVTRPNDLILPSFLRTLLPHTLIPRSGISPSSSSPSGVVAITASNNSPRLAVAKHLADVLPQRGEARCG